MLNGLTVPRRVVITGFGCVTPIGIGRRAYWDSLAAGRSGVRRIESFDPSGFKVQIAGEIPDFDWRAELNAKDRQHVPRTVPLALAAAREAVKDAGIDPKTFRSKTKKIGVAIGTGGGGLSLPRNNSVLVSGNEGKGSIYTIPSSTHGGLSSEISMVFGLHGLSHVVSTAVLHRPTRSFMPHSTRSGRQDVMIAVASIPDRAWYLERVEVRPFGPISE